MSGQQASSQLGMNGVEGVDQHRQIIFQRICSRGYKVHGRRCGQRWIVQVFPREVEAGGAVGLGQGSVKCCGADAAGSPQLIGVVMDGGMAGAREGHQGCFQHLPWLGFQVSLCEKSVDQATTKGNAESSDASQGMGTHGGMGMLGLGVQSRYCLE